MGKVIYLTKDEGGRDMSVNVRDVAKAFLTFESMTHKKLQKLCYYAQAWSLVLLEKPIMDTSFEAWIHGPVCRELYSYYKGYGWDSIPQEDNIPNIIGNNEEYAELIYQIYRIYGKLDGDELELLTHSELPWQEAREGAKPWEPSEHKIDPNIMKDYYTAELRNGNDA